MSGKHTHEREHQSYQSMMTRCYNPNHVQYANYGGRGIFVCRRWRERQKGFAHFYEDMGDRPEGTTLDRIDTDKPYSPDNCRWATWGEQQNNKRNNKKITYKGETHTISDWGKILGIKRSTIYMRAKKNRPVSDLLSTSDLRKI